MCIKLLRTLPIALCAVFLTFSFQAAVAQSGDDKTPVSAPVDPTKEFTDAARRITGPAGNPECVWLGRRVLGRLWDDDLETAFRHLDLYDRFGCPAPHIQQAFRCVVRPGALPKTATDNATAQAKERDKERDNAAALLKERLNECWLNPAWIPQPSAVAPIPATK